MSSKPDNPPRTIDEARTWAGYLADLESKDRQQFFRDKQLQDPPPLKNIPPGNPDRIWLSFLRSLFVSSDPETTVQVDRLLEILTSVGHSRDEALDALKPFVELDSVQSSWVNWETIETRRELRLRLTLLETADTLDKDLCPFLEFFFKASDPSLYRAACLAIGKHLPSHDRLEDFIVQYARSREISLNEPIELNGRRSRRRLLLTLASLRKNHPHFQRKESSLQPVPQPLSLPSESSEESDQPASYLPENQADLGVVMKYFAVMNGSDDTRESVRPYSLPTLEYTVEKYRLSPSHDLLKLWNEQFLAEAGAAPEATQPRQQLKRLWHRAHDNLLDYFDSAESFQERYQALDCWDDLIRTSIRCPGLLAESLLEEANKKLQGGDNFFHSLRYRVWKHRENRGVLDPEIAPADLEDSQPDYLRDLKDLCVVPNEPTTQHFINPREEKVFEALENLAPFFKNREKWQLQHPRERAVRFFVIIDFFLRSDLPEEVTGAAFGFKPTSLSFRSAAPDHWDGLSDTAVKLILNKLDWENPGVESFFNGDLIHEIGDINLLLALLPSGRSGPFLSVLADAFEHQLRLEMNQNPSFDLSRYLLLLTFRDPHPDFFKELARVSETRDYRIGELKIPLNELVRNLQEQIQSIETLTKADPGIPNLEKLQTEFLPKFDNHFDIAPRVVDFREELTERFSDLTDPRDMIENLRELLSDTGAESPRNQNTINSLLSDLYRSDSPMLQSGYPAFRDQNFGEFTRLLETYSEELRSRTESLIPRNLVQYDRLEGRINSILKVLNGMEEELLPPLPFVEEKLLEAIFLTLRKRLQTWLEQFQALNDTLTKFLDSSASTAINYGTIFSQVQEQWADSIAEEVKVSIFDRLRALISQTDQFDSPDLTPLEREFAIRTDPIEDETALIQSGVEYCRPGETVFLNALSDAWRDATEKSMTTDDIRSTIELLKDDRYDSLRRNHENRETLEKARNWALDRYRISLSHTITGQIKDQSEGKSLYTMELFRFMSHYSPIWIALLIGAVLMLDFGAPWTAMAEQGDVRGIAVTFGIGTVSTFLYILADLRMKGRAPASGSAILFWGKRVLRGGSFLVLCLVYTFLLVGGLWYLLSGTGEVLTGSQALGHVVVWTGFSLFFGVFMGLLTQST
ncbi:MAG: hypothetical protein ABEK50_07860 [bacterium]